MSTAPVTLPRPGAPERPVSLHTRPGRAGDLLAVQAMHARCSPRTLGQRFHIPRHGTVPDRLAAALLEPEEGWSRVATDGDDVVALVCAAPAEVAGEAELGILVEDRYQSTGLGARLLRETAGEAAARGYAALQLLTEPTNTRMERAVGRAGLPVSALLVDGYLQLRVPVAPDRDLAVPA